MLRRWDLSSLVTAGCPLGAAAYAHRLGLRATLASEPVTVATLQFPCYPPFARLDDVAMAPTTSTFKVLLPLR